MNYQNNGSWDARTYDQVSYLVQYKWGQQVLEWRKWHGNEIVMDAGCGSGLLTEQLAKKVPRGKVYAVDIDSNMIKQARNNLQDIWAHYPLFHLSFSRSTDLSKLFLHIFYTSSRRP